MPGESEQVGNQEQGVDVVVIGSGFGGSVAALRFARAGQKVVVLERGDRVSRDTFQLDLDALWKPNRASYGFHDIQFRGRNVAPWISSAVGGGSHVYAGTLKRRVNWDGFPEAVRNADITPYYDTAEEILGGTPFPDYPPYCEVRATKLMLDAGARVQATAPELVESRGPVRLAISFAPRDGSAKPDDEFVNEHGCKQRYYDPTLQSILGGDIDAKNTLDRNYLHLAEREGAEIRPLCEADRLERTADGRWRVTYRRHQPPAGWSRLRQRWMTRRPAARMSEPEQIVARRVVVAAGAIGSTELLLRNKHVHETLPSLSKTLGTRYTTNGDYISFVVPFRLFIPVWLAFAALVLCLVLGQWLGAGIAAAAYYAGLLATPRVDPDIGTTNSDYIRFRGPNGESQYAYLECGRYPTPGRALIAMVITGLTGRFRPTAYRRLVAITTPLTFLIPPLGAIARTWPLPLCHMGRDAAFGTFRIGDDGRATLDYDLDANRTFYRYHDRIGQLVARSLRGYWLRNPTYVWFRKQEIPHNQGGVPMGDSPEAGVVDHAGRVFGEPNLMVLDGSIIPVSVGPNPALTITALAERAMEIVVAQIADGSPIVAEAAPAEPRRAAG